jgi:hypothetical protein
MGGSSLRGSRQPPRHGRWSQSASGTFRANDRGMDLRGDHRRAMTRVCRGDSLGLFHSALSQKPTRASELPNHADCIAKRATAS